MAYVRAVWYEESSDKTYSGVAPSNWIIDKTLYWPPAIKEASSFKRCDMPNIKTWTKFLLIKEKLRTDDLKIAQDIPDSTATETEEDDTTAAALPRSRRSVSKLGVISLDDFESDTETEDEPPSKRQKSSITEQGNESTGSNLF